MKFHQKIPIFISITLAIYVLVVLFVPGREIDTKPDIFLVTAGVWIEVIAALILLFVAVINRFMFIGLFMGLIVFLSVSLGRITGSITDFYITVGHNIYTYSLTTIEILAVLGCVFSIYVNRKVSKS